jgi:hypothetical protein
MFLRTAAEIDCHSHFLVSSIVGGPIVRPLVTGKEGDDAEGL